MRNEKTLKPFAFDLDVSENCLGLVFISAAPAMQLKLCSFRG